MDEVRKPYSNLTRQGKWKRAKKLAAENKNCLISLSKNKNCTSSLPHCSSSINSSVGDSRPSCSSDELLTPNLPSISYNQSSPKGFQNFPKISSHISNQSVESTTNVEPPVGIVNNETLESDTSDSETGFDQDVLSDSLRKWSLDFQITGVALCALLCILKTHKCFKYLPTDARTLKKTPTAINIQSLSPGHYSHLGFDNFIKQIWSKVVEQVTHIELLVGIDGIPLFRSSPGELWPILVSVINIPSLSGIVFPIGIYYGPSKPSSASQYLQRFVDEIKKLINNGIELHGKTIPIILKGLTCDAPAKSFVLGIKGHTGYFSCTRCKQEGVYYKNRMTFPLSDCESRTHEDFVCRKDEEYHSRPTPLVEIPGLNMVSSIALDYMHLVCLGVMRTFMNIWVFGKVPLRFPISIIDSISANLISLRCFIPYEFSRKPRSLNEIKRWKATEFRQFLLYTGPLILLNSLPSTNKDIYDLFITLHVAITILISPSLHRKHYNDARALLFYFVEAFKDVYGEEFITHNFHGLTHLTDDCLTFGPLDVCSAFKFENFLYSLKKLVRKGDKPLQQIVKRIIEMFHSDVSFHSRNTGKSKSFITDIPVYSIPYISDIHANFRGIKQHFKSATFQSFRLSVSAPNNCCLLSDGSLVVIQSFVVMSNNEKHIICNIFKNVSDFYKKPCPSSLLGIYNVEGSCNESSFLRRVDEIINKMVCLTLKGKTIVVPLLHSE